MENIKPKSSLKKALIIIGIIILAIALTIFIFLKLTFFKTFPTLEGEPEIGKWYDVPVEQGGRIFLRRRCEHHTRNLRGRYEVLCD